MSLTQEELKLQRQITDRVQRLARCNLDPAVWALLEVLNQQDHHSDVQLKLLETAEQIYGIHSYEN